MMKSVVAVLAVAAGAFAAFAESVPAQDALDNVLDRLTPAQQEALLQGANEDEILLAGGSTLKEAIDAAKAFQLIPVYSLSAPGSIEPVRTTNPNDAVWALNSPNHVLGAITDVTATIVHSGFLTTAGTTGWDHLAIATRGANLEPSLQWLGIPVNATSPFFYGESLHAAPPSTLNALIRGRGPTFWSKGNSNCGPQNQQHPCMLIENYTIHASNQNGLITEAPVALPINDGPFEVYIQTSASNVEVWVWQNGQFKAHMNCQQLRPNDARCGQQAGDNVVGDVLFAHVMRDVPRPHASKHLGVLNPSVTIYRLRPGPCDGCIEP